MWKTVQKPGGSNSSATRVSFLNGGLAIIAAVGIGDHGQDGDVARRRNSGTVVLVDIYLVNDDHVLGRQDSNEGAARTHGAVSALHEADVDVAGVHRLVPYPPEISVAPAFGLAIV